MRRRPPQQLSPDVAIRLAPKWGTSMVWPGPIHEHLDHLVETAVEEGEGEGLSRTELVAALIYAASRDGAELRKVLQTYRRARAGDLLSAKDNVVLLHGHGPGRR
jgi:hypothetical protein